MYQSVHVPGVDLVTVLELEGFIVFCVQQGINTMIFSPIDYSDAPHI